MIISKYFIIRAKILDSVNLDDELYVLVGELFFGVVYNDIVLGRDHFSLAIARQDLGAQKTDLLAHKVDDLDVGLGWNQVGERFGENHRRADLGRHLGVLVERVVFLNTI